MSGMPPANTALPRVLTWQRMAAHGAVAVLAALALLVLVPLVGGNISVRAALGTPPWAEYDTPDALIFWGTRVPRVILGLLTGGALAISGLAFQAVLRNPLAEPYVLGVSVGATLGKNLGLLIPLSGLGAMLAMPLFCFAGALIPVIILFALANRRQRFSPVSMLLSGVMINITLGALMMVIQYFSDFTRVRQAQLWGMGALDTVGYGQLLVAAPIAVAAGLYVMAHARAMNLLSLDSCTASHLGLDVRRASNRLILSGSLLASIVVAVSGPIGFVGLTVPHALRMLFGADNRMLVPLAAVWGGVFLVACDLIGWRGMEFAQALGAPIAYTAEIPVGVITSLIGGPLFLFLLIKSAGRRPSMDS